MRILLTLLLASTAFAQDGEVDDLIQKLGSEDFIEQGRAARDLEQMGTKVLPALDGAAKDGKSEIRDWAARIAAKIRKTEAERKAREDRLKKAEADKDRKKILALIARLGSQDFEVQGKAAADLKAIGQEAVPHLREAGFSSANDQVRAWCRKILASLGVKPEEYGGSDDKKGHFAARFKNSDESPAVLRALGWLARHQADDGSWDVQGHQNRCNRTLPSGKRLGEKNCGPRKGEKGVDYGVTSIALLAFLGAGHTHLSKETHEGIRFGEVVRRGIHYLLRNQDEEGCLGSRKIQKYLYHHMVAATVLVEAYGMTKSEKLKGPARRAIEFIVASQNKGKAWRYSYQCGDNDTHVTGWAAQAIHAALMAGLKFPGRVMDGMRTFLDEVTEENYYRVGYTHKGTGKVFIPGLNEQFDHHETLTAIGVYARVIMDKDRSDPRLSGGAGLLSRDLPKWGGNGADFYYWYYGSLALFQYDGPRGAKWKAWRARAVDALTSHQQTDKATCAHGSWDPVGRWSMYGGRVYATAINALTLETGSRHPPTFGKKK